MSNLDKDGFRRDPQKVRHVLDRRRTTADAWYYEGWDGLTFVHGGQQFLIPRAQVLRYAKRAGRVQ